MSLFSRIGAALGLATKSAVPAPVSAASVPPWVGLMMGAGELTAVEAWRLYKNVATLARVIDLIADQVAHLPPVIEINGTTVDEHPLKQLLCRPGFNRSRRKLVKEVVVQIMTAGYCPLHLIGSQRGLPFALDVLKAEHTVWQRDVDGWPRQFHVQEPTRGMTFVRTDGVNFRYVNGPMSEMLPIYDMAGDNKGIGLSRLNAVRNDVELRARAVIHNKSLIDKGARISGILNFKDALTDDQMEAVQSNVQRAVAGNAGSIAITSGGQSEFTNVAMTPRDMDWGTLTGLVDDAIAARYNCPVTLFNVKAQTNNNYETAWRMLFDNAVLPTFKLVYEDLARVFSERLGQEVEIEPDLLSVPILAERAIANAIKLHGAGLVTRDEARNDFGMEPTLNGDLFYVPMGMVPAGEDYFTEVDKRLGRGGGESETETETEDDTAGEEPAQEDDADEPPPAKKPAAPPPAKKSARSERVRRLN